MVFRLPANLESLAPPLGELSPISKPWQGTLVVHGLAGPDSHQVIYVSSIETEGDK
jgi:hypothetical protein